MVLTPESPLIDAGESSLKDPDGSDSDIGAFGGPDFNEQDADQDGFTNQYDCNDHDPFTHPGAEETWYDGTNQDCSLGSDYDKDGDGAVSSSYGGPDCADDDPSVLEGCEAPEETSSEEKERQGRCSTLPKGGSSKWSLALIGLLALFRRREDRE